LGKDSPARESHADRGRDTFHTGVLWLTVRVGPGGAGINIGEVYYGVSCA
jgi:hypothetical protein